MTQYSNEQCAMDPEWLMEFAHFLEQSDNKKRLELVKSIFVDIFMDNIHDGMTTKDALHNARTIALCFLNS